MIDPKPPKRIKATREEWAVLRAELLKYCAICGKGIDVHQGSLHHILKRSQGGDDIRVNLVGLCGSGTTGCHGNVEARDREALGRLRSTLGQDTIDYLARKKDDDWINRIYPRK